ncbi:bis(5'-nucleosyl)-tetraphosphatase [asymmetrical] [Drosophila grimshawi]|uniref:Bis(5'-nucleosyl)-tetraphosphatase [asymmetrical] n=1 Tax=Drosophila grimshawi TaxID=7222 RepID=B4JCG0_DROGR|nr:bis(5'-nucleosyl)-tetraphosphatase [asymmetrical] [Drosophila grimshawi]EDW03114.1 GH10668 [Drosophila grimshawi]
MGKRAAGFVLFRRLCGQIEYLLLKASYGDFHWSSPKGHVDPGEDDFTTALRETKEEAGYDESDLIIYRDTPLTLNYIVKGKPKIVIYWLAELRNPNKKPVLSEEHTELKWLAKEAAKECVGFKDNQEMIDKCQEMILDMDKKKQGGCDCP